ncbi:hypothetical protein DCAR_0312921 [Daucus carota subsp. sativus]|uniref:Uncharacterized protein n=1 Tax=Daucus carota subsp. sativus TaxID=79200 RepID=A0A166BND8_DAUCS|nr:hypothetical protein DCAR_0312921 [Daucus carota subsp. sativus]
MFHARWCSQNRVLINEIGTWQPGKLNRNLNREGNNKRVMWKMEEEVLKVRWLYAYY